MRDPPTGTVTYNFYDNATASGAPAFASAVETTSPDVIARARIDVNPDTAQVIVTSTGLPTIGAIIRPHRPA